MADGVETHFFVRAENLAKACTEAELQIDIFYTTFDNVVILDVYQA